MRLDELVARLQEIQKLTPLFNEAVVFIEAPDAGMYKAQEVSLKFYPESIEGSPNLSVKIAGGYS